MAPIPPRTEPTLDNQLSDLDTVLARLEKELDKEADAEKAKQYKALVTYRRDLVMMSVFPDMAKDAMQGHDAALGAGFEKGKGAVGAEIQIPRPLTTSAALVQDYTDPKRAQMTIEKLDKKESEVGLTLAEEAQREIAQAALDPKTARRMMDKLIVEREIRLETAKAKEQAAELEKFMAGKKITKAEGFIRDVNKPGVGYAKDANVLDAVGGNRVGLGGRHDPLDPRTYDALFTTHQFNMANNTGVFGKVTLTREDGQTMDIELRKGALAPIVPKLQKVMVEKGDNISTPMAPDPVKRMKNGVPMPDGGAAALNQNDIVTPKAPQVAMEKGTPTLNI